MSNDEKSLGIGEIRAVDSDEYRAAVAVIEGSLTEESMLGTTKDTFQEQLSATIFITRNLTAPHGLRSELKTDDGVVFAIVESKVLGAFRHTAVEELHLRVKSAVTPAERCVFLCDSSRLNDVNCASNLPYWVLSHIDRRSSYKTIHPVLAVINRELINNRVSAGKRVGVKIVLEKRSEVTKERKAALISKGGLLSKLMKGVR